MNEFIGLISISSSKYENILQFEKKKYLKVCHAKCYCFAAHIGWVLEYFPIFIACISRLFIIINAIGRKYKRICLKTCVMTAHHDVYCTFFLISIYVERAVCAAVMTRNKWSGKKDTAAFIRMFQWRVDICHCNSRNIVLNWIELNWIPLGDSNTATKSLLFCDFWNDVHYL